MPAKLYSAFVSSVYDSLREERAEAIDCLLDNFIFPICMEHFTAPTNNNAEHLYKLIDLSDFVVLVLGKSYGSCDEEGVSWTQREYEYSVKKGVDVVAIACTELVDNLALSEGEAARLPEEERRQIAFANMIHSARRQSEDSSIKDIINRYLGTVNRESFAGWERGKSPQAARREMEEFRLSHAGLELGGTYYHTHFSDDDPFYLRIGTAVITQSFTPEGFGQLSFSGRNYDAVLSDGALKENHATRSIWAGEYQMDEYGKIKGIYNSTRAFRGSYNGDDVPRGGRRGIHSLTVNLDPDDVDGIVIEGYFADEAPSVKTGNIFFFRDREKRDSFVLAHRMEALK